MTRDDQAAWATIYVQDKLCQLGLEYEVWFYVKEQISELADDLGFELDTDIFADTKIFLKD